MWIGKVLHCQDDNNGISKWTIYQHTLIMRNLGRVYSSSLLLEYHWKKSWTVCSHTQHIPTSLYVLYRLWGSIDQVWILKKMWQDSSLLATRQDCRLIKSSYIVQLILSKFRRNIYCKLNDFSCHWHSDNAISVQQIVEELRLGCPLPVPFYKV